MSSLNPVREKSSRLKMIRISDRNNLESIPNLDQNYSIERKPFGEEMSKMLVDKMTFSTSHEGREGGALALSAFLMNTSNR